MRDTVLFVIEAEDGNSHSGVRLVNFPILPVGSSVSIDDGDTFLFEDATITEYYLHSKHGLIVHAVMSNSTAQGRQQAYEEFATLCTEAGPYCDNHYPKSIVFT